MKVILATGIYPPEIGGPATYVAALAERLLAKGVRVSVIAYGEQASVADPFPVIRVSRRGGMLLRWWRYAKTLRKHAADADIVYAFSSVSVGVPLWMANIPSSRKVLRLGGDFLWERATDRGDLRSLKDWYSTTHWFQGFMNGILKTFDHIVFSTRFEEELYEKVYRALPLHSVIENTLPAGSPMRHVKHDPLRLLYLGRFVGFKNLGSLVIALKELPGAVLTIVGDGPLEEKLRRLVQHEDIADRVTILPPQTSNSSTGLGAGDKWETFNDSDLLVLPSFTEISPNTALEARSTGLPVLLTEETGLSTQLNDAMMLRRLRTPQDIVVAIREADVMYETIADRSASALPVRSWDSVADEHMTLFRSLL